jgi:two-component system OmpR family response regulator
MQARIPTICVVEDDAAVRDLVRTRLEIAGYRTCWATNGSTALEQCRTAWPDALVLDINMPGMDGLMLLEHWQAAGIRPPPTLMLTARHRPEDVRSAIRLGAKDYLTKPFDDHVLLARVARLLRSPPRKSAASEDDLFI